MWSEVLEKLNRLVDRWGLMAFLGFAFLYLLLPLGRTGLWEPWEMDRADVAKTFHEAPLFPTALEPSEKKKELASRVVDASDAAGIRLDYAEVAPASRRKAMNLKPITDALERTRTHMVGGVLIDLDIAVREGKESEDLKKLAPHLVRAAQQSNQASLILLSTREMSGLEETIRESFEQAYWDDIAKQYCFTCRHADDAKWEKEFFISSLKERGDMGPPMERLVVLGNPSTAQLQGALEDSLERAGKLTAFKRDGVTLSLPPLEIWAISVAYSLLGYTEFATRFPGALFAFFTLLILVWAVRLVWDPKVALLSGLVLLTTPLFYAQAMSAVGETGGMLGLTLVGFGLLLSSQEKSPPRAVWSLIGGGLVVAFFAKGLFALLVAFVLAASIPAIRGERSRAAWVPACVIGLFFGLMMLVVQESAANGYWGQFRFTQKLFSAGPDAYHLNFDLIVNQVGFGAFPWSPLYLFALASVLFSKKISEPRYLILVLWFGVSTTMVMLALSDFNQFLWPAAPVAAVLVGLFLVQMSRQGAGNALAAFVLVLMALILARELGKSPKPLAAFLAFDPPFKEEGAERFPETIQLSKTAILLYAMAIGLLVLHFTRLWTRTASLRAVFRRNFPFSVALGSIVSVFGAAIYLRAVSRFSGAIDTREAATLEASQREFMTTFLGSADPVVQLAWPIILVVLGLGVLKALPKVRRLPQWLLDREFVLLPLVGLTCWIGLAYFALATVGTPDGYWSGALSGGFLLVLVGSVAAVVGTWKLKDERLPSLTLVSIYAGSIVSLALATTLLRDAQYYTWIALGLTWTGALCLGFPFARKMIQDWASFAWIGGLLVGASFLALAFPIISQFDTMAPELGYDPLGSYLALKSKMTLAVYAGVLGLIANRFMAARLEKPSSWVARLEHGSVGAGATVCVALVLAVTTVFGFYKDVSLNVSQKHIIDTYREAEGLSANEIGNRIFRYGSFAAAGKKDSNFYTSAIPTITDRTLALNVLLAAKDQLVAYKAASGKREVRLVQGWNPENDKNADGARDHQTYVGRIAESGPGFLKAAGDTFKGAGLSGNTLYDARDKPFVIASNDSVSVQISDLQLSYKPAKGPSLQRPIRSGTPLVIGNGLRVGLRIPGDVSLARRHAEVRLDKGTLTLRDLESSTGTFLNGKRVQEATLKAGDEVKLGNSLVRVEGQTPASLKKAPGEDFFRIDHPDALDPMATAMKRERSYLLLPANSFGEINFRFRKMAQGRHIPVLSGKSIRVALAGSFFRDGEEQQNRYANHTHTREAFDKLAAEDPKIVAAAPGTYFANFEDKIHAIGYRLEESSVKTGKKLKLRLYFQCVAKLKTAGEGCTGTASYQIYMHIERHKTKNRINGDHWPLNLTSGGEKDKGCTGCYQTNHWLPGDVVVDVYEKEIPQGTPSGTQDMWFGFYKKGKTPPRLKILDTKGKNTRDMRGEGKNRKPTGVLIGSFQVL
jgi:hypothetical protein